MENKLFTVRFRFSKHANFGDFTWLFVQNGQSHKTHEPNVLLTETFDSPRPRYSRRRGLLHVFRNTITLAKLNTEIIEYSWKSCRNCSFSMNLQIAFAHNTRAVTIAVAHLFKRPSRVVWGHPCTLLKFIVKRMKKENSLESPPGFLETGIGQDKQLFKLNTAALHLSFNLSDFWTCRKKFPLSDWVKLNTHLYTSLWFINQWLSL